MATDEVIASNFYKKKIDTTEMQYLSWTYKKDGSRILFFYKNLSVFISLRGNGLTLIREFSRVGTKKDGCIILSK